MGVDWSEAGRAKWKFRSRALIPASQPWLIISAIREMSVKRSAFSLQCLFAHARKFIIGHINKNRCIAMMSEINENRIVLRRTA